MNITKLVSELRAFADGGADAAALHNLLTQAAGVIEANLTFPERTEFPYWRVAQFWSSADPTKKVLTVTQNEDDISAWSKRTDFIGWVGHSNHTYLIEQWLKKTDWVQDQIGTFPMAMPGQHRADVLREEVERLRKLEPVPPKHFLVGPGTVRCGSEGFDAYSKKAVSTAQRLGMVLDEDLRKGKQNG